MPSYRDNEAWVSSLEQRRELRRSSTDAEVLLWQRIRARQLAGAKFRRQHQFGPYILGFYCHESRLAIEVDGSQHYSASGLAKDLTRTAYLEARGVRVVRFTNREVLQDTEGVLTAIRQAIETPSPGLSQGERD